MTRDEIKNIIDGVTDDQVGKILDLYGRDIKAHKDASGDAQKELDSLRKQVAEQAKTIETLEKAGGDVQAMQAELDKYREAEKQRRREEREAQADAILTRAAETALGDKAFVNDVTRAHYLSELKKALADKSNKDKSAVDLLQELTRDATDIFANPQAQKVTIPPVGGDGTTPMTKQQIMQIKDRGERRAAIAANMHLFEPKGET